MRESEIERYFDWAVRMGGGKTYKFKSPTQAGVTDRIACLPNGQTWFVELKAPNGRLRPLQAQFADDMRALNQRHAILWNKEQVDRWIAQCDFATTKS